MHEALDIYIKLLIAIISFIAPLLIHLLSVFSDGTAIMLRRFNEYAAQTANLVKDNIGAENTDFTSLLKESSDSLKKREKESNKQLDLLDPKKQIVRIFPIFFASLVLILLNRIFVEQWFYTWLTKKEWIYYIVTIGLLVGSIYFAVRGTIILRQVVWAIIDVKREIAVEAAKEKAQEKTEKITPSADIDEGK